MYTIIHINIFINIYMLLYVFCKMYNKTLVTTLFQSSQVVVNVPLVVCVGDSGLTQVSKQI